MKKILFYALACMAFCFISCDDFLDIKPKGTIIPQTCEDYERLLNYVETINTSAAYPNYATDDVFLPDNDNISGGYAKRFPHMKNLYKFNENVFSEGNRDILWEASYRRIFTYNVIVHFVLESTKATEEHKKHVRAEGLIGRALEYLNLVNAYANHYDPTTAATDPGVPLLLDAGIDKSNLKRATVKEVYDQILIDLNEAATDLPDKPALNIYRASKPAAYGMLARAYLYMGEYEKALENARTLLELNSFLLNLPDYKIVNPDKWIGRINVPDRDNSEENVFMRTTAIANSPSKEVYGSDDLLALFDKEKDQRYLLYFTDSVGNIKLNRALWARHLFANVAIATPEMYLIAAECESRIGSKDKAMEYINKLRDHRLLNNVALTAADNKAALKLALDERRRELTMTACMRLIDLKRLNREPEFAKSITHTVEGVEYTLKPNDPKYILPIPPNVLRINPDIEQNQR